MPHQSIFCFFFYEKIALKTSSTDSLVKHKRFCAPVNNKKKYTHKNYKNSYCLHYSFLLQKHNTKKQPSI